MRHIYSLHIIYTYAPQLLQQYIYIQPLSVQTVCLTLKSATPGLSRSVAGNFKGAQPFTNFSKTVLWWVEGSEEKRYPNFSSRK